MRVNPEHEAQAHDACHFIGLPISNYGVPQIASLFLSRLDCQNPPPALESRNPLPTQTHARGKPRSSPLPVEIFELISHTEPECLLGATGGSTLSISQPPTEQTHSQDHLSESPVGAKCSRALAILPTLNFLPPLEFRLLPTFPPQPSSSHDDFNGRHPCHQHFTACLVPKNRQIFSLSILRHLAPSQV